MEETGDSMGFTPIRKRRVYQEIVAQIKASIERGEILPGDRLPSERTMAEMLSVSRNSIKEAFLVLESAGVIEIKQGSGVYLLEKTIDDLLAQINGIIHGITSNIVELLEFRQAIEGDSAYYAAIRSNKEDIKSIATVFDQLEAAVNDDNIGAEEDLAFHMAIAKAAKNRVMEQIMVMLYHQILLHLNESRANTLATPGKSKIILEEHRMIYQAIKNQNPQLAKENMYNHLQNVKQRNL